MATPLVMKSWQVCNTCHEFVLRYRLPIYMDPDTRKFTVSRSYSKLIPIVFYAVIIQVFSCLLMLLLLESRYTYSTTIDLGLKISYLATVIILIANLCLGTCLYCNLEIFACLYNTLAKFDSDLRGIYLSRNQLSQVYPSYFQLILRGM